MSSISIKDIKNELKYKSDSELIEICLKLAKASKSNKEILDYELNFSNNEAEFVNRSKLEIDSLLINIDSHFNSNILKILRKTLKRVSFLIKISKREETAVELLIHLAMEIQETKILKSNHVSIGQFYFKLEEKIDKVIMKLHPDLQYDYQEKIDTLKRFWS